MTEIKLCSEFEPQTKLVCDLEKGHRGPHRGTMLWGDERGVRGEVEDSARDFDGIGTRVSRAAPCD